MASIDRLKLRHLNGLVAIAETGSLMRAADMLSITQPAVSKMLAELEDIVGQQLVERSSRGVSLTGTGQVLLRHVGSSLRSLREGLDSIAADGALDAPIVLIGALPNVAATVLPPALLRFGADHPHARVTVRTGSNAHLIADLHHGMLDLVIGRLAEPSAMQGLSFEHLYTEPLVFVVRPGHELARRKRLSVEVLRPLRLVLPDAGTRVREAADRFFMASGMGMPQWTLETIDLSFGRSYVLQSDAAWFVPLGAVENELRQGSLTRLPIDTRATEGPVGLTQRVEREPSKAIERLVTEIRRSAQGRARSGPVAGSAKLAARASR